MLLLPERKVGGALSSSWYLGKWFHLNGRGTKQGVAGPRDWDHECLQGIRRWQSSFLGQQCCRHHHDMQRRIAMGSPWVVSGGVSYYRILPPWVFFFNLPLVFCSQVSAVSPARPASGQVPRTSIASGWDLF